METYSGRGKRSVSPFLAKLAAAQKSPPTAQMLFTLLDRSP